MIPGQTPRCVLCRGARTCEETGTTSGVCPAVRTMDFLCWFTDIVI